jgi:hypothetical protein
VENRVDFRTTLSHLADLLEAGHQPWVPEVRRVLMGPAEAIERFLISNDLWGGSGSIADSAFASDPTRPKKFYQLMVQLGRLQIEARKTNPRTEIWVTAFEHWLRTGVV